MKARSYDIFKTIVAVILLIILLWRVFGVPDEPSSTQLLPAISAGGGAGQPGTGEAYPGPGQGTTQAKPESAYPAPGPTAPPPTLEPTAVPTAQPTQSSAVPVPAAPSETPASQEPAAQATPTAVPTVTAAPAQGAEASGCPLALPARLKAGDTVRVLSRLHMRTGASITSAILLTHNTGARLTITGEPVCEPYQKGAYLWWPVSTQDGQSGWSAEGSSSSRLYFLEPAP